MAIVVPNEAEINLLKIILNADTPPTQADNLWIRFIQSDIAVNEDTTLAALTAVEISDTDPAPGMYYTTPADHEVENTEWGSITSSIATIAQKSLVITNSDTSLHEVYGYFITKGPDINTGVLMWAEKFPTSFIVPANGTATIRITLRLELQ